MPLPNRVPMFLGRPLGLPESCWCRVAGVSTPASTRSPLRGLKPNSCLREPFCENFGSYNLTLPSSFHQFHDDSFHEVQLQPQSYDRIKAGVETPAFVLM